MSQPTLERLSEVRSYFDNGDYHIGYRRLLDATIETQDSAVFQHALDFCDWYDQHETKDPQLLSQQVNILLEKIHNSGDQTIHPIEVKPKLKAEGLGKKYNRGSFSLNALNLTLYPSQIIGLVGENGNGKTTLLRLLYGELQPDSGSISYHIKNIPPHNTFYDIKTRLAFIPQRSNPWYGSLMDNLQFAATHYGFKGKENFLWTEIICARMGLRAFRDFTWNRISSGYKMRFELARTLIKRPEILLLDEPLANLDVLAQQVILEDLKFLAQSQTSPLGIILSSQQLYEVEKVSNEVIFLKNGQPRYQKIQSVAIEQKAEPLVIELETSADRESLQRSFSTIGLKNISFNGGVYIIYFSESVTASEVIRHIGETALPVKYFRDITSSSRRFFDA